MKKADYAIYNNRDELLYVGTAKECAAFLNMKENSIRHLAHRTRTNQTHGKTYTAYTIEDDEE